MAMPTATRWSQTIRTRLLSLLARAHGAVLDLHRRQEGLSAVEYLLIATVVVVVLFAALKLFFGAVADKFGDLTRTVSNG
jgi:Flp pilus assembly pilin Flp